MAHYSTDWGDREIAIIAPRRDAQDWWERDHHLARSRDDVLRALGLDDETISTMDEHDERRARALRQSVPDDLEEIVEYLRQRGWDATVVDVTLGVTDDWPSMGDSDCGEPYLLVADYLSYLEWCRLAGVDADYTIDETDIRHMIAHYGAEVVGEAASLLPEDDPLRQRMERATEQAHT